MDPHVGAASLPLLVQVVGLTVLLLGPWAWCVCYASIESIPRPSTLLALLVGWCLIEMTIALVLGVSGAFHLGPLMSAEGIVFVTGLVVARSRLRTPLSGVVSVPDAWTMQALLAGIALVGASLLIRLATTPTTDYDSLAYHLPVMARWYQSHRFTMLEQFYDGPVQLSRYPYGWEALAATFLMPFGNDFLVALPNLVAWLLFGVGIHVVAVQVGARPIPALAFTLLALTTPIAREHVETMHVDLALGAFFMAGVGLALAPA